VAELHCHDRIADSLRFVHHFKSQIIEMTDNQAKEQENNINITSNPAAEDKDNTGDKGSSNNESAEAKNSSTEEVKSAPRKVLSFTTKSRQKKLATEKYKAINETKDYKEEPMDTSELQEYNSEDNPEFISLTVGEKDHQGNFLYSLGYNQRFSFKIRSNDEFLRPVLEQGWLYDKHSIVAIWPFIELQKQLDLLQPQPLHEQAKKPQQTILVANSNIGHTAIPLAKCLAELDYDSQDGRVLAFEPQADIVQQLHENIKGNEINNIAVYNNALGHEQRKAHLSGIIADGESKGKSLNYRLKSKVNYGGIQLGLGGPEVAMITVDSLKLPKDCNLSLMKIDVEGIEPLLFYGAQETIKAHHPIIIFEMNDQIITEEMKLDLELNEENKASIPQFDILSYAESCGYNKLIQLPRNNYMLIHPFRDIPVQHQAQFSELFIPMTHNMIRQKKLEKLSKYKKLQLFLYAKPKWSAGGEQEMRGKQQRAAIVAKERQHAQLKRVRQETSYFLEQLIVLLQQKCDFNQKYNESMGDSFMPIEMVTGAAHSDDSSAERNSSKRYKTGYNNQ
jgi:FkbM family methyltransferase